MKTKVFYLLLMGLILASTSAYAMLNPAAVYCQKMGYTLVESSGGGDSICRMPDGTECGQWAFLTGKCGTDYSYCKKNGLGIKIVSDPKKCETLALDACAVCVKADGTETAEITQFMNLDTREGVCGDGRCVLGEDSLYCPQDCPTGAKDGVCDGASDGRCDPDCVSKHTPEKDPDCAAATSTTEEAVPSTTEILMTTTTTEEAVTSTAEVATSTEPVSTEQTESPSTTTTQETSPTIATSSTQPGTGSGTGVMGFLPYIAVVIALVLVIVLAVHFLRGKKDDDKDIEKRRQEFERWKQEQDKPKQ